MRWFSFVLALVVACTVVLVRTEQARAELGGSYGLWGTVSDQNGNPAPGVTVSGTLTVGYLKPTGGQAVNWSAITDNNGIYTTTVIVAGHVGNFNVTVVGVTNAAGNGYSNNPNDEGFGGSTTPPDDNPTIVMTATTVTH